QYRWIRSSRSPSNGRRPSRRARRAIRPGPEYLPALRGCAMTVNVDPAEIAKFSQPAHRWWDPTSEFRPLHEINPLRLDYIDRKVRLAGKEVLDVGCGGGILAEAMAERGARVDGIDMSEQALKVAQLHLLESGANVNYRLIA